MTRRNRPLFALILILLATSLACSFSDLLNPAPKDPTQEVNLPTEIPVSTPTETEVEDTPPTEAPEPTEEPTPEPPNNGQIVYVKNGNVWRFLVASGVEEQITFDGIADDYYQSYQNPRLSSDGRFVAYVKNEISIIHEFATNNDFVLSGERFIQWSATVPDQYYTADGSFTCPAVENLENQDTIFFDVYRDWVNSDATPAYLGTVTGGLFFPQSISNDEAYLSILQCACYSECGGHAVVDLSSEHILYPTADLFAGEIEFSPNSARLTVAQQQIYGYVDGPLYLANPDFSGAIPIYSEVSRAAYGPKWSPTGEWIGFTIIELSGGMEPSGSQAVFTNAEGTILTTVEGGFADFLDWSPDGSQILFGQNAVAPGQLYIYDLAELSKTLLPIDAQWEMDWGILP